MASKPVWGPQPETVANDKLNQMVEYSETISGIGLIFLPVAPQPVGLLWGYGAGRVRNASGAIVEVAAGQIALTANATNYVEVDSAGAVSKNTTAFTASKKPLRVLTTDGGSVLTSVDKRVDFDFYSVPNGAAGGVLNGTYPNPGFAVDMATQAELDAVSAAKANVSHTHTASQITDFQSAARDALETTVGAPVSDAAAMRAVAEADRQDKQTRLMESNGSLYRFDSSGTGTDDGDGIITPTTGSGRWFKVSGGIAVTSVTGTAPIASSGGTTPAISIAAATTGAAGSMSAADKSKLDGIATGATANATNAELRDRATHTGTQAISTVANLQTELDAKAPLASPALTGTPTAPTAANGTNTTQIATTAFVLANSGGGGGGHTIQDEGSGLTARTNLNFVGSAVTVTDDSGNDATKVTITGGVASDFQAAILDSIVVDSSGEVVTSGGNVVYNSI